MPVTCKEKERCLTALVAGELDHHGAREVMEELDRRIDQAQPRQLTLDQASPFCFGPTGIWARCRGPCGS